MIQNACEVIHTSDRIAMLKEAWKEQILCVLGVCAPQCSLNSIKTNEFYDRLLSVGPNILMDTLSRNKEDEHIFTFAESGDLLACNIIF